MNKIGLSMLALASTLAVMLPAQAADSSEEIATKVVKVPVIMSAVVAGVTVGTPVAVVHDTLSNFSSARDSIASQFGGQSPDACQYLVADFVALPAGLAGGLVNGTYHGFTNAINNCNDRPFSAESFCLRDSCYDSH